MKTLFLIESLYDGKLHVASIYTSLTEADIRRAAKRDKKLKITAIWQLTPPEEAI